MNTIFFYMGYAKCSEDNQMAKLHPPLLPNNEKTAKSLGPKAKVFLQKEETGKVGGLRHPQSSTLLSKRSKAKFAVIADDITGACDAGVQFKKHGLSTIVVMKVEHIAQALHEADVIVFNTDSRADAPLGAYKKVKTVAGALRKSGIELMYKKIDSTLRGNIGPELEAAMDELGIEVAIVAPAFPANNRTTVGGHQLVNQVPVMETEFAYDPTNPVKESHIPTLIQAQVKRRVGNIDLSYVMKGTEALKKEIDNQRRKGKEIIVVDAATQDHLETVANAASVSCAVGLTCGSAGLAEELPQTLKLTTLHPVTVISGSLSSATRRQILRAAKDLEAHIIDVDPLGILEGGKQKEEELKRVIDEAAKSITRGLDVIITTARVEEAATKTREESERLGLRALELSEALSLALGEVADRIAGHDKTTRLFLTGGSTATRACAAMGATGLIIETEVLPGIPSMRIIGGKHDGLRIVTKAGGFGTENAIAESMKYLKESS
jgi:uncharacterized protein YgbK (DUF1537 family)